MCPATLAALLGLAERAELATMVRTSSGSGDQSSVVVADPGFSWEDKYFADTEGVVAVFDFDYEKIINFDWEVTTTLWLICPQSCIIGSLFCQPCFAYQNISWRTKAQHVAVHRDGIKYVTEKQNSGCGFQCQDIGKSSKTVPFDKLTDCDVQEPAGTAVFCCVQNVLSEVTVDTASSGGAAGQHELILRGLKDPHGFKKCVWDCKRGGVNFGGSDGISAVAGVGSMSISDRSGGGSIEMLPLLAEIRDELKLQTQIMKSQGGK
jgi:hypothetical protein